MSIDFTQEQRSFAEAVAAFCKREAGTREQRDALTEHGTHTHNQALYEKMAELGWLGSTIAEEFGGADGGAVDMCILLEEAAKGMAPIGGIGPTLITGAAYAKFGTQAQKESVLGGIVEGRSYSISMSEPEAGSDVGNLSCRAEKTAGGWLINGQKTWCSNAHFADRILLVARTGRGEGKHEGLTMFDVPADAPGLSIVGIDTMGGKEVNDLYFTDCLLPEDAVIGVEGQGWGQLMTGLNIERLILAAMMLGTAQRADRKSTRLNSSHPSSSSRSESNSDARSGRFRHFGTVSPISRRRSNAVDCSFTTSPASWTRTRPSSSRGRRRWRNSSSPRPPRRLHSRACR